MERHLSHKILLETKLSKPTHSLYVSFIFALTWPGIRNVTVLGLLLCPDRLVFYVNMAHFCLRAVSLVLCLRMIPLCWWWQWVTGWQVLHDVICESAWTISKVCGINVWVKLCRDGASPAMNELFRSVCVCMCVCVCVRACVFLATGELAFFFKESVLNASYLSICMNSCAHRVTSVANKSSP